VELDKRHIIYLQAILQPARAANLRPETILAMAQVNVTLHNDMLSAPMKGGFALLNDKVSPALVDKSALFNFGEMARIGPWINKQCALVLDFVFDIGLKNARCVRSGRKGGTAAQILAREGAIASGAPPDASGRPTNKAAMDWLLMGAEEGTRDMTWGEIEEGADKLRAEGQIVARAGALESGAPPDASGQPKQGRNGLFAHGRRGGHARQDVGADRGGGRQVEGRRGRHVQDSSITEAKK